MVEQPSQEKRTLKVAAVLCLLLTACQENPRPTMTHEQWMKAVVSCISADNIPLVTVNSKQRVTSVSCIAPHDMGET